jgi:glycosyltransferase involved in cell wall biosynthesis
MKNISVDVFMATYNHEKYIRQAIESFLNQKTDFKMRLIIGEDFSTDNTAEIVKEYASRFPDKIAPLINNRNMGMTDNSVQILNACHAPYFAMLEGDDFWTDPLKLQKQVDFLEANPDYGLVHTDVNFYYQESNRLIKDFNKTNDIKFPNGNIFEDLLTNLDLFIKTATVLARTEIYKNAYSPDLIKEKHWIASDLPTMLEISLKTKIKYFNYSTATYRLLEESASRTHDQRKKLNFHKATWDVRLYYWEKYSRNPERKKVIDKYFIRSILSDAYKMRDWDLVKKTKKDFIENKIKMNFKDWVKFILVYFDHQ